LNLEETEVAAAVEAAVNVEKVRKRLRKRTKHRPTTEEPTNDLDTTDGREVTSRTQRTPQDNHGYDDEDRGNEEVDGNSQARENLGYEDERESGETGETSREPKPERTKTGKRRRKKLKGVFPLTRLPLTTLEF
jgi:hypothetical protein